jgi:hypothetical protein
MLLLATWKSSAATGLSSTCAFHSTLVTWSDMMALLLLLLLLVLER